MEFQNTIIDKDVMDKEPTVVDKLFDLVGEESVEFKQEGENYEYAKNFTRGSKDAGSDSKGSKGIRGNYL